MAVTLPVGELAVAIRAATNADNVSPTIVTVLTIAGAAAADIILDYAPHAPDSVHNAAYVRLVGWLYDSDPADPSLGRALQISGAEALLSRWRSHRAGAVGEVSGPTPSPSPTPTPGTGLPPAPARGHFILTVTDGVLRWISFPEPPAG